MVYKNQSSNKANEPSNTTFLWFDPLYIFSSLQLQRGQKRPDNAVLGFMLKSAVIILKFFISIFKKMFYKFFQDF
jgi:hypothetical protein